ncbi:tryptophan synthase subunit alpha [Microlunatus elymi]|uniref:tryptophan synthase subunit alpha n=1 Tax=Microlunatus elymi TaxID=2596828 RepID=UPI001D193C1D|nr:tryptophan synthase subunit alpha [Microlunatus elymi]
MSAHEDRFDEGISGKIFSAAKADGRGALVGYLPVGYPSVPGSLAAMRALCGVGPSGEKEYEGVDLVEIGMPYSDPVMDGPTIQKAATRALERGVRVRDVFSAVEAVAETGTAAVVMIYWNLVERYGPDAFARDLAAAGGAGLITPDLTPDEAEDWFAASDAHGLDRVFLVAPSSSDRRLAETLAACRGWVYATSLMGVTGARAQTSSAAPTLVQRIRTAVPSARIGVGLGVSTGAQAAEISAYADAAIVGSALVSRLIEADEAGRPDDLTGLRTVVSELATGIRSGLVSPAGTSV